MRKYNPSLFEWCKSWFFPSLNYFQEMRKSFEEPGNFKIGRYEITDDVTARQHMDREIARTEREMGYAVELIDIAWIVAGLRISWRAMRSLKNSINDGQNPCEESDGDGRYPCGNEWRVHLNIDTFQYSQYGSEPVVTAESIQEQIDRFKKRCAQNVSDCIYPILLKNGMEEEWRISRPDWIF